MAPSITARLIGSDTAKAAWLERIALSAAVAVGEKRALGWHAEHNATRHTHMRRRAREKYRRAPHHVDRHRR